MRTLLQIVAVLGYLTAACALTTSLYKPLPSLSLEILGLIGVVVHLALGLIFGRWWAVLLPALPLAVAAFVLRDQPWAIVAIPFAVVVALVGVALVGVGVAVGRGLAARESKLERPVAWAATASPLLCWVPVVWALAITAWPLNLSPEPPRLVDELGGSYRGAHLGDSPRRIRALLGDPSSRGGGAPLGEDLYEIGGPTSSQPPPRTGPITAYRYRGLLLELTSQGLYAFTITDGDAETRHGVGVGDSLATVRRAYPDLHCGTANEGTEYITFPYCGDRIAPQRYVWFGEDPIRSISLSVTPLG